MKLSKSKAISNIEDIINDMEDKAQEKANERKLITATFLKIIARRFREAVKDLDDSLKE